MPKPYAHETENVPEIQALLPVINRPFDAGSLTPLWTKLQLSQALAHCNSEAANCTASGDLAQAADFTAKAAQISIAITRHP